MYPTIETHIESSMYSLTNEKSAALMLPRDSCDWLTDLLGCYSTFTKFI